MRDREDFRCSRSTAERKITIHVRTGRSSQVQQVHSCTGTITIHMRDREDFRCSRSTAAQKITINVGGRGDFKCSRSTTARKITINEGGRGRLQVQQVHNCTENYHN